MLVYHYTSVEGLYKIVTSKSLWVRDISKMNDSAELAFGKGVVEAQTSDVALGNEVYADLKDFIENLDYYICCFSEAGDSLSQWRAYARDGAGVAIGFEVDPGATFGSFNPLTFDHQLAGTCFDRVEYVEHHKYAHSAMLEALKEVQNIADLAAGVENDEAFLSRKMAAFKSIAEHIPLLKHSGFREEREWRLVFFKGESGVEVFLSSDTQLSPDFDVGQGVKFACTGDDLVRLYSFPITDGSPLMLSSVTLGPKCRVSQDDLNYFLRLHFSREITTDRSSISYR